MTPLPADAELRGMFTATMNMLLAVSPNSARIHTRCRSLNNMDKIGKSSDMSLNVPLQQKRHNLARSQVNSSEYFSVAFEVSGKDSGHEFLLASKGTSLAEALGPICSRKCIELCNVEVLLEQYKTPLPVLTTDTAWLGGKHITVRDATVCSECKIMHPGGLFRRSKTLKKDGSDARSAKFSQPSRKTSRSCKGRSSFFSSSTEDGITTSDSGALSVEGKPKGTRQRWSGLFGNSKDSKMEILVQKLDNYSKFGIPQLSNKHDEDLEESLYKLEDDWKEIVSKTLEISDSNRHQQAAIWELIQTEVAYIHTLKLVTDLFLSCLVSLQKCNVLTDIDKNRLFSNIEEISHCNINLWAKHLLPMLATARETSALLDPSLLLEAFVQLDDLFAPYVIYCSEQGDCQKYCREKTQTNELFTAYLVWCETQKDCHRLRLIEMLVKPMQRLTKYSLLFKAILKHTTDPKQRESLEIMIERMDSFVNGVNTTLKQKEDLESLRSLILRIEGYDVAETKDDDLEKMVKAHNFLDLKKPMHGCNPLHKRQLIAEADLKLKDYNSNSKIEVHCILLTDMLLVCKVTRACQLKVIRPPYLVNRLIVHELTRETPTIAVVYLSEYATAIAAFLLIAPDAKIMKTFVGNIRRAEGLYNAAKQASDDTWRVEPDSNSDGYSGSVEMGCSPISNVSRGLSVESEMKPLSHSSDEVLPQTTDTLRVVVPQLGQSLPDLKEASRRWLAPPPRPLVPPPAPPRGASYPPPSPPLRRSPAIRHNTMDKPDGQ